MTWQDLIRQTALDAFNRTGRLLSFRLKRGDLVELAAEIAGTDAEQVRRSLAVRELREAAIRCHVYSPALGREVVVDEWVRP